MKKIMLSLMLTLPLLSGLIAADKEPTQMVFTLELKHIGNQGIGANPVPYHMGTGKQTTYHANNLNSGKNILSVPSRSIKQQATPPAVRRPLQPLPVMEPNIPPARPSDDKSIFDRKALQFYKIRSSESSLLPSFQEVCSAAQTQTEEAPATISIAGILNPIPAATPLMTPAVQPNPDALCGAIISKPAQFQPYAPITPVIPRAWGGIQKKHQSIIQQTFEERTIFSRRVMQFPNGSSYSDWHSTTTRKSSK